MDGVASNSRVDRDAEGGLPSPPDQVGDYRLLELIGEGGMGRVFRARHTRSEQLVALKTVNRMTRLRMLALRVESASLRSVRHRGVVRIIEEGTHRGMPWYAMELLTGLTIADYNAALWEQNIARTLSRSCTDSEVAGPQPMPPVVEWLAASERLQLSRESLHRVLELYRRLCEPLAHIHARGMVHRDLKPANVFVREQGGPVLMDFGLTSFASGAVGREVLDAGDRGFGTPQYTAPERLDGRFDARSDLYSLGCMLFETLVGHPPFQGDRRQVVFHHLHTAPPVPSDLVDGVPEEVDALVVDLLQKIPQARIVQASDVAARISRMLGEDPGDRRQPATLYRPRLSGRGEALSWLQASLKRARDGDGAVVLVGGVSGVGKTFLTSEFAESAAREGFRVVTGEALPTAAGQEEAIGSAGPLHPLRRLLQSIADVCREGGVAVRQRVLANRAEYMAPFEPSLEPFVDTTVRDLPVAAASERALASLRHTLHAYALISPTVLILDDLQWADDLTLELLLGLDVDFFAGLPLLIVGTYRSEQLSPKVEQLLRQSARSQLLLPPLDATAVREMVSDMLSGPAPRQLVEVLLKESSGNPFFVAEYLRYLVSEGLIERTRGQWRVASLRPEDASEYAVAELPSSLADLLARRLRALSPLARRLVEACAVLGREFKLDELACTLESQEGLMHALREAQERQVIAPQGPDRFRFLHDKLREASYAGIDPERRECLHRRAAAALVEVAATDHGARLAAREVARHHRLSGELALAIDYLEQAAKDALALSAQREAAACFAQALELAERVPEIPVPRRAGWCRELGGALHDVGDFEAGNRHLLEALRLQGEAVPFDSSLAMGWRIASELARQVLHRVVRWQRWGGATSDSGRALERARCLDRLQQAYYYAGNALPMAYCCLRTLNTAEAAGPSPELTIAYANARAVAGVIPARGLAAVYEKRARANMVAASDPVAETYFLTLEAVYCIGLCAWDAAGASIDRGLQIAASLEFGRRLRELSGLLSTLGFFRGEFGRARQHAQALKALAVKTDVHTHCWSLLCRAQALLCQGALDAARRDADEAIELADGLWRPERIWAHGLAASIAASRGEWDLADRASRRALEEIERVPTVTCYTIDAYARVAEVRIALYRRSTSSRRSYKKLARRALRSVGQLARVFPLAAPRSHLLAGRLAEAERKRARAVKHYAMSLRSALELQLPYDQARARLSLGQRLEADHLLQRLGADPFVGQLL